MGIHPRQNSNLLLLNPNLQFKQFESKTLYCVLPFPLEKMSQLQKRKELLADLSNQISDMERSQNSRISSVVSSVLVSLLGYGNSMGYIQILVSVLSLIVQMEAMVMLMWLLGFQQRGKLVPLMKFFSYLNSG